MSFDDLRSDTLFLDQFRGRQKEVEKEAPFVAEEIVEGGNDLGILEAAVAKPLTDMGPVFLFDVCVIILVVRAGASDLDGLFAVLEVADEMPVEEFGAVVAVKAENREREAGFDVLELL